MKIRLVNISKVFKEHTAVKNFSADIASGHLIALLGPSGCGKSTMLNMLSGILEPTSGSIYFDDEDVTLTAPEKRGIGLVFQNYALYPHMTVLENICFPLEIQKVPKKERIQRAEKMMKLVHVEQMANRKPGQLSGGQQQRVAIARALIKNPRLLLLDEPLSNLDARLRIEMREEIRRIQQETKVTTIFVTHDQEEAMSISDDIILMKEGVLQQYDQPQNLYDQPANCFVADFLGTPPINKIQAVLKSGQVQVNGQNVENMSVDKGDAQVYLSCRSESILINQDAQGILGKVVKTYIIGKESLALIQVGSDQVRAYIDSDMPLESGQEVRLSFKSKGVFVFEKESGERLK